jgi:NADH-quinone oxidoreductase subunit H
MVYDDLTTLDLVMIIVNLLIAIVGSLVMVPVLVWMERRCAGLIQDRLGPNRCHAGGFRIGGLVQSIADVVKLVFKEDFLPAHIKYKKYYLFAPSIVLAASFLTFGVIPFADDLIIDGKRYVMQVLPIDLGILWFLAFAGLSVYGIIIAGWASDNKYSILGGLRASAQVISYEASMGLSLIAVLSMYGSIHLNEIVKFQGDLLFGIIPAWGIILQPISFVIFIFTAFAETNRTPFDIAEGESEIVAGFHTEYSALRFGTFFVGEYVAMGASSAIIVTLFLGGYHLPFIDTASLKSNLAIFCYILIPLMAIFGYYFTKWIAKNNVWPNPNDKRAKETGVLLKVVPVLFGVIILALLFTAQLSSSNSINIAVAIFQVIIFFVKLIFMNFVYIWVRWTLPRFRYDQLQNFGWKMLLPLAIANVFVTATVVVMVGS